ncbi:hypothetical protein WICANDRAFT_96599 [Wickerhamomyces anomalus NRRL Y-366-8]|uniref:Aspartate/glutamate racemase family protein n=1 Tax=Wickerhamomyces anomalus (strain ATCC 58044 / CBS 1984 / NCYC 433 / NRRL Y-366-8) TaxID=683960 RepID=A0A1E3P0T9_WICAA|nr:uncharacterized protein WICANDRAFT_96599 [Wickerhamomyces anomalus NRRL Y-366-8]ODQ58537.1 hypothetical protein WICANDRAFT_96599 [Wickerhamomyces anomalus NRRL Y-366-8]
MSTYPPRDQLPPLGALGIDYTEDIHRPPGDPLNELSYHFPVIHQTVPNATVPNVVASGKFSEEFLQAFVDACNSLEKRGAIGIITSCGFLAQVQHRLAEKINIPIATSSLLQVPLVLSILSPKKKVAILTFDGETLGEAHFEGIGVTPEMRKRVKVFGCKDGGHLRNLCIEGTPYVHEELEKELVELAETAVSEDDSFGAFVLECTQMPPTSKAIQKATGLPVYDAITMIDWFYSGLRTRIIPEDKFKEDGLRPRKREPKDKYD